MISDVIIIKYVSMMEEITVWIHVIIPPPTIAGIYVRSYNGGVWSKNTLIKKQSKSILALNADEYYENSLDEKVFHSIIIDKNGIKPQGSLAEAHTEVRYTQRLMSKD